MWRQGGMSRSFPVPEAIPAREARGEKKGPPLDPGSRGDQNLRGVVRTGRVSRMRAGTARQISPSAMTTPSTRITAPATRRSRRTDRSLQSFTSERREMPKYTAIVTASIGSTKITL